MSTWRKRFSRKPRRFTENNEILLNNTLKYRKKLQITINQINRTKKCVQRNLDQPDSEIHVARLIHDIGQLTDCTALQEISGLIESLSMRYQLSARIFNEYSMNALEQSLAKLNNDLSNDFDTSKSVFEDAVNNHCSDRTKNQLFTKVQTEWSKHQKLAMKEFKHSFSSYCDIGLYNLKVQLTILEKLQNFVNQMSPDENDLDTGLPDFTVNSQQTRKEIDTMLRVMLDSAPNNPSSLPNPKRPRLLTNQLTLANSLNSAEITEAAAAAATGNENIVNHDSLPSYTDLFVIPGNCKEARSQRRSPRFNNQ